MLTYIFVCKLYLKEPNRSIQTTFGIEAQTVRDAYNELFWQAHLYHPTAVTGFEILEEKGQNLDLQKEETSGNLLIKCI
jgi:hypothetical protein